MSEATTRDGRALSDEQRECLCAFMDEHGTPKTVEFFEEHGARLVAATLSRLVAGLPTQRATVMLAAGVIAKMPPAPVRTPEQKAEADRAKIASIRATVATYPPELRAQVEDLLSVFDWWKEPGAETPASAGGATTSSAASPPVQRVCASAKR